MNPPTTKRRAGVGASLLAASASVILGSIFLSAAAPKSPVLFGINALVAIAVYKLVRGPKPVLNNQENSVQL